MHGNEMDKSKLGNRYALYSSTRLSHKVTRIYTDPKRRAGTMVKCLMDFIYKHGIPDRTIHDRAEEFFSEILQETVKLVGITYPL